MGRRFGGVAAVAALARIGALVGAGAVVWGCRHAPAALTSQSHLTRLLDAKPDTGVALRALLLRDTVAPGDRAPVELLYAVVNGPRPSLFDNHPWRYRILVTGPDGQPAKSLGGAGPASGAMGRFEMKLPAGGSLVQRQDLRCVNDYAYSTVRILPSRDTCLAMYALSIPGQYRVVVEYFGPDVLPNLDRVTAAAHGGDARVRNNPPLVQGVLLADTATFVVTGR